MMRNFGRKLFVSAMSAATIFSLLGTPTYSAGNYFRVPPSIQLGYQYKGKGFAITWVAEEAPSSSLTVEYKSAEEKTWKRTNKFSTQSVNGHPKLKIISTELGDLPAGSTIDYRVSNAGKVLFESAVKSPPETGKPVDFGVLGDIGQGTDGESDVAGLWRVKHPPLVLIMGDIVYPVGSMSNYLRNFYPFLNEDVSSIKGTPVLRSTLTVGVVGNHDVADAGGIDARDLTLSADGLAYYLLWHQPLNGPVSEADKNAPVPRGSQERIDEFLKCAGPTYPKMGMFSFDYGDCHFLALDANLYVDWTDAKLRAWVENDLKTSNAPWKVVCFHHPGFNSDWAHREHQQMRHLCDIFERTGVDICFAGHSHSYQRSYPLRFKEVAAPAGDREAKAGFVFGKFEIDKSYDGDKITKPKGIIYVVTGAGGAHLSSPELDVEPGQWLPFTKKFIAKQHSMTFCHAEGKKLTVNQVACDGSVVDSFSISK